MRSVSYVLYFRGIFGLFPWQLWWCGHLAPSGCPALKASPAVAGLANFHYGSHPRLYLRGVMFSFVGPFVGVFLLWLLLLRPRFGTACPTAASLRLLCDFFGYVCQSCSCADGVGWAAAFPFRFSVLLSAGVEPAVALAAAGFGDCPCNERQVPWACVANGSATSMTSGSLLLSRFEFISWPSAPYGTPPGDDLRAMSGCREG